MPVTIHIPTPLRPYTGGAASVSVDGATVGEALAALTSPTPHPPAPPPTHPPARAAGSGPGAAASADRAGAEHCEW